jgi:hypothetical protein
MPVAVPPFNDRFKEHITPPAAPQDPPSVADVAAAIRLKHDALLARGQSHGPPLPRRWTMLMALLERSTVTDGDLVKASKYEVAVLAAVGGMLFESVSVQS